MTRRVPVTLLAAAGALVALVVGNVTDDRATTGWALAILAALALSLMLHGPGLRVLGVVMALLAMLGAITSLWTTPAVALAFVPAAFGGVVMVWFGPRWTHARRSVTPHTDMWKQMDAGYDPTD